MGGQRRRRLLVAAERVEGIGQAGEQRIIPSLLGEVNGDRADRFAVVTVHDRADGRTQRPYAVTTSEEGEVTSR